MPILTILPKYTHQNFHKFTNILHLYAFMLHLILCVKWGFSGGYFLGPKKHQFSHPRKPDRGEEYVCGVGVSPTDQDEDHLTGHTGCLSRLLMVAWELKNLPRRGFWPFWGGKFCWSNTVAGELGEAFFFLQNVDFFEDVTIFLNSDWMMV